MFRANYYYKSIAGFSREIANLATRADSENENQEVSCNLQFL